MVDYKHYEYTNEENDFGNEPIHFACVAWRLRAGQFECWWGLALDASGQITSGQQRIIGRGDRVAGAS